MILRRKNTWYSVCDGNWSDYNTWVSNRLDKKIYTSPQPGDDVYINHSVTCDVSAPSVNNLYVSGDLLFSASLNPILTVNGDLQATGTIDQTGTSSAIVLKGYNNFITTFIPGSSGSAIVYNAAYTQYIMPVTYWHLYVAGGLSISRIMTQALTVNGNLYLGSILNTQNFSLTVNGISTTQNALSITLTMSGNIISTGSILFVGQVLTGGGRQFQITGAASVEMRGGAGAVGLNWPTANVTCTTNNQTISDGFDFVMGSLTVSGAITVTNASGSLIHLNGALNGTVAGSTLNNNGSIIFNTTSVSMTTGTFNYANATGSTIGYSANGSYALPYTSYEGLTIGGTGLKTLSANTTVNYKLTLNGSGGGGSNGLNCLGYNLTVGNTTSISGAVALRASLSGGTLIFIGQVTCGGGGGIITSDGNPTLEFRGGINNGSGGVIPGTGTINFTTNNQSLELGSGPSTWSGAVNIASGITITNTSATLGGWIIAGQLNGLSSTSTFINNGNLDYQNANAPMLTGNFYCNQATNTFRYNAAGNQDIQPPNDAVSPGYKNLTLAGSGAKRLLGNVSVKGTYTLTPPATLNSNGFSLTNP